MPTLLIPATRPQPRVALFSLAFLVLLLIAGAGYSLLMDWRAQRLTPAQKQVPVFGHAGYGFLSPLQPFNPYPANSLSSLRRALADGADGLEVDLHLSRDGVPVMYHDLRLESITPATGLIEEQAAAAVLGLPYRSGLFYDLFHGEKVAAFETLLQEFIRYPDLPHLHLDLRQEGAPRSDYYARQVLDLLRRYRYPVSRLSFIAPDVALLAAFRRQEPRATYLVDSEGDFEETLQKARQHRMDGIVMNGRNMDAAKMRQARRHGLQVVLFGPKSKGSIYRMLLLQPDALEVNNVAAMVDLVRD